MEGKEGKVEGGGGCFHLFFFQRQLHLSFSPLARPQITATIPQQSLLYLLPKRFHQVNMLIFTKWKPVLLHSSFVTASQQCFCLSDGDPNEKYVGLHFQDASWIATCKVEETDTFSYINRMPVATVLCAKIKVEGLLQFTRNDRLKISLEDCKKKGSWRSMEENLKKKKKSG